MASTLTVATANLHAGIDGWGRPFDAVGALAAVECDLLLLQETWTPDGREGLASELAAAKGFHLVEATYATGRRALPHPRASSAWLGKKNFVGHDHSLYLDSEKAVSEKTRRSARYREAEPGSWGTAILSRFPIASSDIIELDYLGRDRSRRRPLLATVEVGGQRCTVISAHMSHLTYGSVVHYRHLNSLLQARGVTSSVAILGGDMNLWGPPVVALLRGWRRAVKGRTWPAWRPHSQLDHLLVTASVQVRSGEVLADFGSDHRAVRAVLTLPEAPSGRRSTT